MLSNSITFKKAYSNDPQIKIEKKKDSEPESDIDIDVDSDSEAKQKKPKTITKDDDAPIAVPLENFEPMPRRQKKINLVNILCYCIFHFK